MKKILFFLIYIIIGFQTTYTKELQLCVVIPAYNEEQRIGPTLAEYIRFFSYKKEIVPTFLVVANNCSDNTTSICKNLQKQYSCIKLLDFKQGGKGFAVKQGFLNALEQKKYDLIGFVDADLATKPRYFYELINPALKSDGAIASRYISGANVWPARPFLKKVGGKLFNFAIRQSLGLPYKDTQCGAKIFKHHVVAKIIEHMKEVGWVFDLELLFLCKINDFSITEVPTTWSDMPGSHLRIHSVAREFLSGISRIKKRHKALYKAYKKEKRAQRLARRRQRKRKLPHL